MLYITIGAPGSGKSTYAKELQKTHFQDGFPVVILNADELRGYYGKDETDQSVSAQAFEFIRHALNMLLKQGFHVLIDVTSKDMRARAEFLAIARKYKVSTMALVFNTPLEICQARNAARSRVVPPDVVERIYNQIVLPAPGEFNYVNVIQNH